MTDKDSRKNFEKEEETYPEKLLNHIRILEEQLIASDKKVEEQNSLLRHVLDSKMTGYWDWHVRDNYEYFSPGFSKMLGYSEQEIDYHPTAWRNIIHPDDFHLIWSKFKEHVHSKGKIPIECETRYFHKDGSIVWFYCMAKVIDWSSDGQPLRMIGTHVNITPLKSAENYIQDKKKKYQLIVKNLPNGAVFILDKALRFTFADGSALALAGLQKEEIEGKLVSEVFSGSTKNLLENTYKHALEGVKNSFEFTENGKTFYAEAVPVTDNEIIDQILILFVDITKRKKSEIRIKKAREKAEKASKAKTDFLSAMSHEIRTPLNAIIGMTHWLLQEKPRKDQLEVLQTVKISSENLLYIINDILDFSKIEANKIELEQIDFKLKELVKGIRYSMKYQAAEKNIEFKILYQDEIPDLLKGDPVRLNQILVNLISNAIKFTHKGYVRVSISLEDETDTDVTLEFKVEDTGIGIPNDKLKVIFESFTQSNADITRKYGGTGLGLNIIKNLLKLFNSEIEVKSKLGKGSVFSFNLKLEKGAAADLPSQKPIQNYEFTSLNNARILLVDDNKINRDVAAKFLLKWDAVLDFAENGKIALEKVQHNKYDMVLMDLHMPVMDGYQCVDNIRKLSDKQFQELPIFALTVSSIRHERSKIQRIGFNGFISKPFMPQELHQKLLHILKKKKENKTIGKIASTEDFGEEKGASLLDFDVFTFLAEDDPAKVKSLIESFKESIMVFKKEYEINMRSQNKEELRKSIHKVTATLRFVRAHDLLNIIQEERTFWLNSNPDEAFISGSIKRVKKLCNRHIKLLNAKIR